MRTIELIHCTLSTKKPGLRGHFDGAIPAIQLLHFDYMSRQNGGICHEPRGTLSMTIKFHPSVFSIQTPHRRLVLQRSSCRKSRHRRTPFPVRLFSLISRLEVCVQLLRILVLPIIFIYNDNIAVRGHNHPSDVEGLTECLQYY